MPVLMSVLLTDIQVRLRKTRMRTVRSSSSRLSLSTRCPRRRNMAKCAKARIGCRPRASCRCVKVPGGDVRLGRKSRWLAASRLRYKLTHFLFPQGIAEALSFISTLPESEGLRLMQRLALDPHPLQALSTLQSSDIRTQASSVHALTRGLSPEGSRALEYELRRQHSNAYPIVVAIDPSSLPRRVSVERAAHIRPP